LTDSVELTVSDADGTSRLDIFLTSQVPDLSRSRGRALIKRGLVRVAGSVTKKPALRLAAGQVVTIMPAEPEPSNLVPWDVPLTVVYEDDELLVIDKPAGMTVHPAPGHPNDTLANAVIARWPDVTGVGESTRPGIVHRLDADTSGLIVVAKTPRAHAGVAAQFADRSVDKHYTALVVGSLDQDEAVIEAPIGRSPRNRKKMAVVENGRAASTGFRVIHRFNKSTMVDIKPATGRTHQIRVHFGSIGHAVVGDTVYGRAAHRLARQFLHASALAFDHPVSGRRIELTSPLPEDLTTYLSEMLDFSAEMTTFTPKNSVPEIREPK
jgi:23S rRNA pseudouridine1911/1915/1917 synthase